MAKVFVIDVSKCNGCQNCQIACKDEHCGNDWMPYAKPQPDTGHFWMKVHDEVCGSRPKVFVRYTPILCGHCENPACMQACPNGAIYRREDGFIIIDPARCAGCGRCKEACPYDVIFKNEELGICQKCTGCAHLLDNGYEKPRCVEVCPTDALMYGEEEDMQEQIEGAVRLKSDLGLRPRVYYRNIPGQFIAGTVYDPVEEEIIEHARCLAVTGGRIYETFTDGFGDFWFKDLSVGRFDVTITADGYEPKYFHDLHTRECLNLGDIPMEKTGASE